MANPLRKNHCKSLLPKGTYEYDDKRPLDATVDQNGDICTYLYDKRDLLTQKTYGNNGEQTYFYDEVRRLTKHTDNNGGNKDVVCEYAYDLIHRQTKQALKIGTATQRIVEKFYDAFGHRTKCIYPNGRVVEKTFTNLHQTDLIKTDVAGDATLETVTDYDYQYDSAGDGDLRMLLETKTLESTTDTKVEFEHDELGRITKKDWTDISAATTLVGFEYEYDLFGNRTTDNHLHRSQDSETYSYDTAVRFTKYQRGTLGGSADFFQDFELDDIGNWTRFNDDGTTEDRSHDSVNAITNRGNGVDSIQYDLNGNQTRVGIDENNYTSYFWDELNRLTKVEKIESGIKSDKAVYFYCGHNMRVVKRLDTDSDGVIDDNDGETRYYYCGNKVMEERDETETLLRDYVHGGQYIDEVILVDNFTGGETYNYYMSDLRFSVYGFIDSTGSVVERERYDAYGKRTIMDASFNVASAAVDQEFGYTGRRHDDESELMYFRNRYFDVDQGRFIGRDPLGSHEGMGLYGGYFVPRGVDPLGLWNAASWHLHYATGGGAPVDLHDIGVFDLWKPVVQSNIDDALSAVIDNAINQLDKCVKEGSFTQNVTGNLTHRFDNIPSCSMGRDADTTDVLYVIGCSSPAIKYNVTINYECKCCEGDYIYSSISVKGTADFDLNDAYSNPQDTGGAFNDTSGPMRACNSACWEVYRTCASNASGSGIRLCSRARSTCLQRCTNLFPSANDPLGTPYDINAEWTENINHNKTNSCN